MIFEFILIVFTILLLKDYLDKKRINKVLEASGVSGPKYTPLLIGHLWTIIKIDLTKLFDFHKEWLQKYGKVYRLWCLNKCVLVIQDVDYMESILSSTRFIQKPFLYDQLSVWLGDSLLLSKDEKWQKRRKVFIPSFNMKILEQFVETFDKHSHVMVDKLRDKANGETIINMLPVACSTSLDILLETAMGVKMSAQSPEGIAYTEAIKSLTKIVCERYIRPIEHFDITFKLISFKAYRTLQKNVKHLHGFTKKIINERRSELMKSTNGCFQRNENEYNELGIKKRMTFLDILLQATIDGKPLTNEEIREEVDTFSFGGHDTLTHALSYIFYLISRHPEVQQKAFDEVLQIIGPDKTRPVCMRELQKLKYLECVIKESLRLYPPAPAIGRITKEDHKIGNDKIIPANTTVILLLFAACRDPDHFPNPDDFLPERFACANGEKINPYAFAPFSAGPRNCIGQKFAMLQMKSIVSCLLRHYEFLPMGPEVDRLFNIGLTSSTGMHMGIKLRDY